MSCPSCGKALSAPENAVGKKAKCPACGQIMIVPEAVQDAEEIGSPLPPPSTPLATRSQHSPRSIFCPNRLSTH